MKNSIKEKDLTWIRESLISHRGLHDIKNKIPENSMKAFKESISNGFAIECDVRISNDDLIYVFHDRLTKRLCNENHKFEKLNSNKINELRLINTNEKIPLLSQVLDEINGQVPLMIEIKPTNRYKKLSKILVEQLKSYTGEIAIQSYSPIIIAWFKRKHPDIIRGLIQEKFGHSHQPFWPIWYLSQMSFWDKICQPDFYNYNIKDLPNKKMDKQQSNGKLVISFTARNQKDLDFVKNNYSNAVFEKFIPKKNIY